MLYYLPHLQRNGGVEMTIRRRFTLALCATWDTLLGAVALILIIAAELICAMQIGRRNWHTCPKCTGTGAVKR